MKKLNRFLKSIISVYSVIFLLFVVLLAVIFWPKKQETVKPEVIDDLFVVPTPIPEPVKSLKISVNAFDKYFVVFGAGKIEGIFEYTRNPLSGSRFLSNLIAGDLIEIGERQYLFWVQQVPYGCEGEIENNASCIKTMSSLWNEYLNYGGLYKIDLQAQKLSHLFKIPRLGQYGDMSSGSYDTDTKTYTVSIESLFNNGEKVSSETKEYQIKI